MSTLADLYKTDFHAWTQRAATLVREHKLDELNLEDLTEKLDSMGAKERRELMNRLDILLAHLLKWEHQPDHRTGNWDGTIREQRRQLARDQAGPKPQALPARGPGRCVSGCGRAGRL